MMAQYPETMKNKQRQAEGNESDKWFRRIPHEISTWYGIKENTRAMAQKAEIWQSKTPETAKNWSI